MKYILFSFLFLTPILSFAQKATTTPIGQSDKKECECETCLAKGNCVSLNHSGRGLPKNLSPNPNRPSTRGPRSSGAVSK